MLQWLSTATCCPEEIRQNASHLCIIGGLSHFDGLGFAGVTLSSIWKSVAAFRGSLVSLYRLENRRWTEVAAGAAFKLKVSLHEETNSTGGAEDKNTWSRVLWRMPRMEAPLHWRDNTVVAGQWLSTESAVSLEWPLRQWSVRVRIQRWSETLSLVQTNS